ncbi:MAG: U32 family peptidase [Verrucomicrobiales bacterium]|nr:U32 family peptidase [Verrucomicrobiales bacterium]
MGNFRNIELLAPAGNWDCARAAVANGADAIYFGLPRFNARLRADNFSAEELPDLMRFLHDHGVRGFVAFNTLVFTAELAAAEEQLAWLQRSEVDAVIVQDLGLATLVRRVAPDVELHASTQMTITSPEGLEFARELGVDRAVLARELSLRELERFGKPPVPLEVFVHGALCVAYSGQCLTSESLGQRSANRGECAQACRMPYQLVVDGVLRDLGDKRYLLSPQDLAAVDEIPRLVSLGVASFKIEGRLKSPEYVAAVTQVYRKAIDASLTNSPSPVTSADRHALEMTFSRGLFSGWMHGVNHQELVGARFGKKRGPFVGRIAAIRGDGADLDEMRAPLKPGDGIVFDTGEDTDREQGGFLFAVAGQRIELQRGKIDWSRLQPGDRVWKTSDPALDRELRRSFKGDIPVRPRRELHVRVSGSVGEPLVLAAISQDGTVLASASSAMSLQAADRRPLTTELLREQLGRLGGTGWRLAEAENHLSGSVMLPASELNRLRRQLLTVLDGQTRRTWKPPASGMVAADLGEIAAQRAAADRPLEPELVVLCRTMDQIRAALAAGIRTLYVDFEEVRRYREAVDLTKAEGDTRIFLATPRIQKPGEQGVFKLIELAAPHGILVRNLGGIRHFTAAGWRCVGDFSLNVANPLTARHLMRQGLERLTVSYDLNAEQALDLLHAAPPSWFELTIHQHMPMFHMEHCVFAAFLSSGKTFLDCGRPCEKHAVKLRDRVGMEHPLKADVGCRNTLFNAVAQTGARYFPQFQAAGLRRYRIELLEEPAEEAAEIIQSYQKLLAGEVDAASLWMHLRATSQLGVTSGTLRQASS